MWSGDPPGGLAVLGRPSRRCGSGREAIPEARMWSGGLPKGPEVVERPSRRYGSGWESLREVLK